MILALELDNIICTPVKSAVALNDVAKCELLPGAKEALEQIKKLGHRIMIYTHRDASLGPDTETWLQRNKVPYDAIFFNKPHYDLIIDTKCHKMKSWDDFLETQKYRLHNS